MKTFPLPRALLVIAGLIGATVLPLSAQTAKEPAVTEATVQKMADALKFRNDLVLSLGQDKGDAVGALARLRGKSDVMGVGFPAKTDLALAALDIGQRLLVARKPVAAEIFFLACEESWSAAIAETRDSEASAKAELLERRAYVRDNFLNKTPEADSDLAEAIKLTPDDQRLQRKRDLIPALKANRPKTETKG